MKINDNNFAKRFRSLRRGSELTQEQFLKIFNAKYNRSFTAAAISQYENGKRIPEIDALMDFADHFGVTVDYLLGNDAPHQQGTFGLPPNVRPIKKQSLPVVNSPYRSGGTKQAPSDAGVKRFPILGKIACGEPVYAVEEHESYVEASANIQADFCLIAQGDSMVGARILDGDMVFIRAQDTVENGQIAAVIIDDEATLKRWRYYPEKSQLILSPENPAYEPLVYVGEELRAVRCLGLAVCFMSNL